MTPVDKPKELEENEEADLIERPGEDSSDKLSQMVDWAKDKGIGLQLAMAGDADGFGKPALLNKQEAGAGKPPEKVEKQGDKPDKADPRILQPEFARELPPGVLEAPQKLFEILKAQKPGQALSPEQRTKLEGALADARKLSPTKAAELEKKLVEDVQSKDRKLPDGRSLPPWTIEKEKEFVEKLGASQKAFAALGPETKEKVADIEKNMNNLAADDIRRDVFKRILRNQAENDPALRNYLDKQDAMAAFTKDNAGGLMRRAMHQQEMIALHAPAFSAGVAALVLDRAGQEADRKQIETLLRSAMQDRFALANIPDLAMLSEKYKIEQKQDAEFDEKIPGRSDLRKALEIMNNQNAGTHGQRLEKARPFFEKAIGASDRIDLKDTLAQIEKAAKERNELGENITIDKLNELENRAVELIEKVKIPYEARVKFAYALNEAAAEGNNPELAKQAFNLLKAAERLDPANEFDPILQGAMKLVQEVPPRKFDEKEALAVGQELVEKRKEELIKEGKKPEERPLWLKALVLAGETAAGLLAFHLMGKYLLRPLLNAKTSVRRSWELSSRVKNIEAEASPSLKPGEEPRLMYRNKEGNTMPVESVRFQDGKIRVRNGDRSEAVKLAKGDSLYMAVPPDHNLSKEQIKELAAKKLAPVAEETALTDQRQRYEEELQTREREVQELKRAQSELQAKLVGKNEGQAEKGDPAKYESLVKESYLSEESARKLSELPAQTRELAEKYLETRLSALKSLPQEKQATAKASYEKGAREFIERCRSELGLLSPYPELFNALADKSFDSMLLSSTKDNLARLDAASLKLYNDSVKSGYLSASQIEGLVNLDPETRAKLNEYIKEGPGKVSPRALDALLSLRDSSRDLGKIKELEDKAGKGDLEAAKELAEARKKLSKPLEKILGLPVGAELLDASERATRTKSFERYLDLLNSGALDGRALSRLAEMDASTRSLYEAKIADSTLRPADLQKIAMMEPSLRKVIDAQLGIKDGPLSRVALEKLLDIVPKTEQKPGEGIHDFHKRRAENERAAGQIQEGLARSPKVFDAVLKALNDGVIEPSDLGKMLKYDPESRQVDYNGERLLKVLSHAERFDAATNKLYSDRLRSGHLEARDIYKLASLEANTRAELNKYIAAEPPKLAGSELRAVLDLHVDALHELNPGSPRFDKIVDGLSKGHLDRASLEMLSKMPESQRKVAESIISDALAGKNLPKTVNEMLWDKLTPDLNLDSKVDTNGWNKPVERPGAQRTLADLVHADVKLKAVLESTATGRELVRRLGNLKVSDTALGADGKLSLVLPENFDKIESPQQKAAELVKALARVDAENAKPTYRYGSPEWQRAYVPSQVDRDLHSLMRERAFIDEMNLKGADFEKLDGDWRKRFYEAETKQVKGAEVFAVEFDAKSADPKAMQAYLENMDAKTKRKFDDLIKHLEGKKGPLVVDFGAGSGGVSAELAKMGIRAVPLDLSPEMVSFLRKRRSAENLDYFVLNKDSVRFFMGANSFDALFGSSELHEVGSYGSVGKGRYDMDSIREAISQRAFALKEGGPLVIRDFVRPADGPPLKIELTTARSRHLLNDFYQKWQASREGNPNKTDLSKNAKFYLDGREVPYEDFRQATTPERGKPRFAGKAQVLMDPASAMEFMISVKHPGSDSPNYKNQMAGVIDEQFCNLSKEQLEKAVRDAAPPGYKMEIIESQSSTSGEYKDFWKEHFKVTYEDGSPVPKDKMPDVKISLVAVKIPEGASIGEYIKEPAANTPEGFKKALGAEAAAWGESGLERRFSQAQEAQKKGFEGVKDLADVYRMQEIMKELGVDAKGAQDLYRLRSVLPSAGIADLKAIKGMHEAMQAQGMHSAQLGDACAIYARHGELAAGELARLAKLSPEFPKLSPESLATIAVREGQAESFYGVEKTKADAINSRALDFVKAGVPVERAHDAAALSVLKYMDRESAAELAKTMNELRQRRHFAEFSQLADTAKHISELRKLAGAEIASEFEQMMREAVQKNGTADLDKLKEHLSTELAKRSADGAGKQGQWQALSEKLAKTKSGAELSALLGLPEESKARKDALDAASKLDKLPAGTESASEIKALELNAAEKKALDFVKEMQKKYSGLELRTPDQVSEFLKSCHEAMEEDGKAPKAERDALAKMRELYGKGDVAASLAVNSHLELKLPVKQTAPGTGMQTPGTPGELGKPHESVSLADLERRMSDPVERGRALKLLEEKGPVRETLARAGMSKERARRLEKDLFSEKEEVRKRAELEIDRFYESRGRGGFRGFASEASGRMGAMVMVAAVVLPWLLSRSADSSSYESSATWTGGGRR